MAQKYFPIMPAVDWLQLTCTTPGCILQCPEDSEGFSWKERDYGTKQYAKVYNVTCTSPNAPAIPFATICAAPRMSTIAGNMLSLQLSNQILYDSSYGDWRQLLVAFCKLYGITIIRITRCDFALDFLYLANRVSGPKLIRNLKNFVWLKTGTVKVSEHYTMPYSVTKASDTLNGKFDIQYYMQQKTLQARVETMMFGTMKSDAAVCIYDKTAELARHSVRIEVDGKDRIVCEKEYIRDCHKNHCVYDPNMHTWRIEIRVKNTASFIRDMGSKVDRCLMLTDLAEDRISSTIQAALNHYFYLVETPADMLEKNMFNPNDTRLKNKKRLKKVELVPTIPDNIAMVRSRKVQKATQYTRSVLNRIEEWATRKERAERLLREGANGSIIDKAITEVDKLCMQHQLNDLAPLAKTMRDVKDLVVSHIDKMDDHCKSTLIDAISIIEHFRILETRGYSKSIAQKFEDLAYAIDVKDTMPASIAHAGSFIPSDAAILRSAKQIAETFYMQARQPLDKYKSDRLYEGCIYKAIHAINERPHYPPVQAFNAVIGYMVNKEYLSDARWHSIFNEFRYTPFYLMVSCKFDMQIYFMMMHYPRIEGYHLPALTPPQIDRLNDMVRYAASIKRQHFDNNIFV